MIRFTNLIINIFFYVAHVVIYKKILMIRLVNLIMFYDILQTPDTGSHYTTKSELFSPKIQIKNSKNGLGRAKQYFLGYGFALPRLISARRRVWEECARDSGACCIIKHYC